MRKAFRTRLFTRWMYKAGLSDAALLQAVAEMAAGLIDANLGGHVLKKRIALASRGKSGGARVIVATKGSDRWFFLYGFGKNERSNIDQEELRVLQEMAQELLNLEDKKLASALSIGAIIEVVNSHENK